MFFKQNKSLFVLLSLEKHLKILPIKGNLGGLKQYWDFMNYVNYNKVKI